MSNKLKIIIVFLILVSIAGIAFTLNYSPESQPIESGEYICTTEAKLCPDGSYVGRSGPKCEFARCPNAGTKITARINQKVVLDDVSITPLEVVSDSRCPKNVNCVWAGSVIIKVKAEKGGQTKELELELGKKVDVFGVSLHLDDVLPVKTTDNVSKNEYNFVFGEEIDLI
jgi:hypothetical protein